MAKSRANKGGNGRSQNVDAPEAADPRTETGAQEQSNMAEQDGLVTLTKRNVQKNGIVTYAREGVNASVYFNKSMFNGDAPDQVTIGAVNLRQPGEGGVGGGRSVDPAKLQERAEKAQANAAKAQERAQKAADKAAKLAARIAAASGTATE